MSVAAAAAASSCVHFSSSFSSLRRLIFFPAPSSLAITRINKQKRNRKQATITNFSLDPTKTIEKEEEEDIATMLKQIAECLILPSGFIPSLPRDLRLDLNDAAFDLANGPVVDECGEEVGEFILNLARAWEKADTSTSNNLARKLPSLERSFNSSRRAAFGKRLISAGRRFQAMGQYGEGEVQRIAKTMIEIGKLLTRGPVDETDEKLKVQTRTFKFGDLQVALTPEKAYIGSAIGLVFGILSWGISRGIQGIPENSLVYANDNATLLATSLRGALMVLFYFSTVLSAFASVGLLLLGRQLNSENNPKD